MQLLHLYYLLWSPVTLDSFVHVFQWFQTPNKLLGFQLDTLLRPTHKPLLATQAIFKVSCTHHGLLYLMLQSHQISAFSLKRRATNARFNAPGARMIVISLILHSGRQCLMHAPPSNKLSLIKLLNE